MASASYFKQVEDQEDAFDEELVRRRRRRRRELARISDPRFRGA